MDNELLKIFNDNGDFIGTSTRDEVHAKGLWHETFHCWFISKGDDEYFIHFQLRSKNKKDYPNKLDISAAGHLLSNEAVEDGIREVHEELGVNLSIENLIYIGKIPDVIIEDNIIDKEYGHVYFYLIPDDMDIKYEFEDLEVSGVIKVQLNLFELLWFNKLPDMKVEGIVLNEETEIKERVVHVGKTDFLPHEDSYISTVLNEIKKELKKH